MDLRTLLLGLGDLRLHLQGPDTRPTAAPFSVTKGCCENQQSHIGWQDGTGHRGYAMGGPGPHCQLRNRVTHEHPGGGTPPHWGGRGSSHVCHGHTYPAHFGGYQHAQAVEPVVIGLQAIGLGHVPSALGDKGHRELRAPWLAWSPRPRFNVSQQPRLCLPAPQLPSAGLSWQSRLAPLPRPSLYPSSMHLPVWSSLTL
jgi:hypothetical protein